MKDLKQLPMVCISRENLKLVKDLLEPCQAGEIMLALYSYIYEGLEPTFQDKITMGVWNQVIAVIERKGDKYMKQVEAGKKNMSEYHKSKGHNTKEAKESINPEPQKQPLEPKSEEERINPPIEKENATEPIFDNYSKNAYRLLENDKYRERIYGHYKDLKESEHYPYTKFISYMRQSVLPYFNIKDDDKTCYDVADYCEKRFKNNEDWEVVMQDE